MEQEYKKIGTHSGQFHADEVLACVMLTKFTKNYKNGVITRTRDSEILDKQDLVVDVGGVYEPERHRYDHHQRSFEGTLDEDHKIKLSGAGLIYKHFGLEVIGNVIRKILSEEKLDVEIDPNDENIHKLIYDKVYSGFIESVDGEDNGVNQYTTDVKPNYKQNTSFGSRIGRMNTSWIQEKVLKQQNNSEISLEDQNFKKAIEIAHQELVWQVKIPLLNWYPARPFVIEALKNRKSVHSSGQILKFDQFVPYGDHLFKLEIEQEIEGQIKFVLFPEGAEKKAWRVKAINLKDSFDLRMGLKKEWRGIKDMQELKKVSQIDDIVFVHVSGFIGGARSYESALRMATESIEAEQ